MKPKAIYIIHEDCVGCGSCKTICAQHAISKGMPYLINAHKCIGCGKCVARCWRKLITRVKN